MKRLLGRIAVEIMAEASRSPGRSIARSVMGRLQLLLSWNPVGDGGDWYLSVWREEGAPREKDLRFCRAAFAVPGDAARTGRLNQGRRTGFFFAWYGGPAGHRDSRLDRGGT